LKQNLNITILWDVTSFSQPARHRTVWRHITVDCDLNTHCYIKLYSHNLSKPINKMVLSLQISVDYYWEHMKHISLK